MLSALRKDPNLAQYLGLTREGEEAGSSGVGVETLFERLDRDQSGTVSWEEFTEAAQVQQQLEAGEKPEGKEAASWPYSHASDGWEVEANARDGAGVSEKVISEKGGGVLAGEAAAVVRGGGAAEGDRDEAAVWALMAAKAHAE